jgi:type VI secretion system protein ImpC
LYTLPAARGDLPRRLRDALAPFIEERQAESRVVCVLLDFPFDAGGEDLALLASIGGAAAAWRVPVIAPLDPARLAADPDDPVADVRSEWERFRQADEAEWVALAANRFLLRMPYGASGEVVRGFRFEEAVATRKDLLWGGAHWLVGALVARSFAMTGWGADLTGARTGGLIEDLPVAEIRTERGERTTSPLEHLPNEAAALRWIRHGLVAVAGRRDTDQALLVGSPVAHGSEQTLTQRLFEAQVQAMGRSIGAHTDARRPAEEIASTLAAGLNFLASGPDGPLFRATVEGGADGALLRITPERPPLRGLDSFVIRIQRS